MSFPISPTNGQTAIVNGISYTYSSATRSWLRNGTLASNIAVNGNVTANNYVISGTGIFYSNGTAFSSGGTSFKTYTSDTAPPASGNVTGDQWYNTSTDIVYEWQYDGTSYYWVDITSSAISAAQPNVWPGSIDLSGNLTVGNNVTVTGNIIAGNLQVAGGAGGSLTGATLLS